jgi:hypothetical protein
LHINDSRDTRFRKYRGIHGLGITSRHRIGHPCGINWAEVAQGLSRRVAGIEHATHGLDLVQLTVFGGAFNEPAVNDWRALRAGLDQRVLAKNIDYARDSPGIPVNKGGHLGMKNAVFST